MKRLLRKYILLVQLLLFLVGLVLIILWFFQPKDSQLGLVLVTVGTAIAASAVLSIFQSVAGTDTSSLIDQTISFNRQVSDLGLDFIHLHIGDESIFNRFENARSIDMMYNTSKNTCYRYMARIEQAIVKKHCRVRILISNPENPIWAHPSLRDGLCPGTDVPGEIRDVLNRLQLTIDDLEHHTPRLTSGSLEVRMYSCAPTSSIVIVDGTYARFTPYLPYTHSSDVPIYDFSNERGGQIVNQLQVTFDRVWSQSQVRLHIDFAHHNRAKSGSSHRGARQQTPPSH